MFHKLKSLLIMLLALSLITSCATSSDDINPDNQDAAEAFDEEENAPPSKSSASTDDESASDDDGFGEDDESSSEKSSSAELDEGDEFADEFEEADDKPAETSSLSQQANEAAKNEPTPEPSPMQSESNNFAPAETMASQNAERVEITNINYMANQSGGTVVISTTGNPTYKTRLNSDTNQFIVEVANATLPSKLTRPFITKEFEGASFAGINAYQNPGSSTARIVVQLKQGLEPVVQTEGTQILVIPASGAFPNQAKVEEPSVTMQPSQPSEESNSEAKPTDTEEGFGDAEKWSYDTNRVAFDQKSTSMKTLEDFLTGQTRFYGRRISIETTKDADVRDVVNFIAEQSGLNIVMSDKVNGKIQLRLRQVPWDQALYIVMKVQNLGYVREGSVLRIAPIEDLRKEAAIAKEYLNTQKTLSPMRTKVVPISYASVKDLVTQVTAFLSPNRKGEATVAADDRTASLIITDTAENLNKIERLIKELDIPPTQVLIEGKVVEAQETFSRKIGLNISDLSLTSGSNSLSLRSSAVGSSSFGVTGNISGTGFNLTAFLDLSESDQMVRIVSSPRIMTINNKEASIEQTGQVLQQATTVSNGTTTTTITPVNYSLSLKVTPQITSDASVIMAVNVVREFPSAQVDINGVAGRAINSRKGNTTVMVKTGETAVIGGIFQNDENNSESGITGLMNIPVVGWLFKHRNEEQAKNELLIFLTPRILNIQDQGVSVGAGKKRSTSEAF